MSIYQHVRHVMITKELTLFVCILLNKDTAFDANTPLLPCYNVSHRFGMNPA